jgi:hypothetical protein
VLFVGVAAAVLLALGRRSRFSDDDNRQNYSTAQPLVQ